MRIDTANKLKQTKYEHFLTDITTYKPSLIPFEVGSHTGHISRRNRDSLKQLHTFCKKNIKLKQFVDNISAICILSSFYIFNCRDQQDWEPLDPILAPFSQLLLIYSDYHTYSFRQETIVVIPAGRFVSFLQLFVALNFHINPPLWICNFFIMLSVFSK